MDGRLKWSLYRNGNKLPEILVERGPATAHERDLGGGMPVGTITCVKVARMLGGPDSERYAKAIVRACNGYEEAVRQRDAAVAACSAARELPALYEELEMLPGGTTEDQRINARIEEIRDGLAAALALVPDRGAGGGGSTSQ